MSRGIFGRVDGAYQALRDKFFFAERTIKVMGENRHDLLQQFCAASSLAQIVRFLRVSRLSKGDLAQIAKRVYLISSVSCSRMIANYSRIPALLFSLTLPLFSLFLSLSPRGPPFRAIGEMTMHD